MNLTTGELMFYGGISGILFLFMASIILVIYYHKKKRKLLDKIQEEY